MKWTRLCRVLPLAGQLACACALGAQPARAPAQLQRVAVIGSDLSRVTSARELSDGRVIVSDAVDRMLHLLDPRTGTDVVLGRIGSGPREYRFISKLITLGGDTTLAMDGQTRRWLWIRGAMLHEPDSATRAIALKYGAQPEGMDHRGNLLMLRGIGAPRPGQSAFQATNPFTADSIGVIRIAPTGRADTVARFVGGFLGRRRHLFRTGGDREFWELANPLQSRADAVLFADGRIAVAYPAPYRVDWIFPDGRRAIGTPVPYAAPPVTERVRAQLALEHARPENAKPFTPDDFPPWPRVVPPFRAGAVHAGADGQLYVERTLLSKLDAPVIDVFDQNGFVTSFALPPRARFLIAGTRGIYAAVPDEDDVQSVVLFRSPAPTARPR